MVQHQRSHARGGEQVPAGHTALSGGGRKGGGEERFERDQSLGRETMASHYCPQLMNGVISGFTLICEQIKTKGLVRFRATFQIAFQK